MLEDFHDPLEAEQNVESQAPVPHPSSAEGDFDPMKHTKDAQLQAKVDE